MKKNREYFEKPYEKAQELDEKFARLIAKEHSQQDIIDFAEQNGISEFYVDDYIIKFLINEFTTEGADYDEIVNELKSLDSVKLVSLTFNEKYGFPELTIETEDGIIDVKPFSKTVTGIEKIIPDINSKRRNGHCFELASRICTALNRENDLVIGHIYGYTDKAKYLHSWVETKMKGQDVVIDATLNAVINKSGFDLLEHCKEINRISSETYRSDLKKYLYKYSKVDKSFYIETYMVSRDEFIRDLEKNKHLFEEEELR